MATHSSILVWKIPWAESLVGCSPWDYPGKNTGVGCHPFLQGIFLTQGSNPHLLCLLPCRWILYHWATGEAWKDISTPLFISALFTTAKTCFQETTVSVSEWVDKENVIYAFIPWNIFQPLKQEENSAICENIIGGYYAKWNKQKKTNTMQSLLHVE